MLPCTEFLVQEREEVVVEDHPVREDEHQGIENTPDQRGRECFMNAEGIGERPRGEHKAAPEYSDADIEHDIAWFGKPTIRGVLEDRGSFLLWKPELRIFEDVGDQRHATGWGLREADDQGVDDCSDAEGEEDEDEVDPEVLGEPDFETHGKRRDDDGEDDEEDFVVCDVGHWLRLLWVGDMGIVPDFLGCVGA